MSAVAAGDSQRDRPRALFVSWLVRPEAPALAFLIALLVFLSLTASGFLTAANVGSILTSIAVLGIVALGVNMVVLTGEIDISVGSALGLCAVASGTAAKSGGLAFALVVSASACWSALSTASSSPSAGCRPSSSRWECCTPCRA